MARTIIFYGTLYIAAFMLALDTGIKRSTDLLAKYSFVKSQIWGFLPLILLLVFGGMSIYDRFVPRLAVPTQNEIPSTKQNPLADDALKWELAQHLRDDFGAIFPPNKTVAPPSCQAVIVYYQTPFSEHFANNIGAVVASAGAKIELQFARKELPPGIRLVAAASGEQRACATRIKVRLEMDLGILNRAYANIDLEAVDYPTLPMIAFGELGKSFEIDIGNEPGS